MKTNLKQMRKAAGWSNADAFAKSIGIPPKTYRNYEQGVRMMGMDVACEICNALGCSVNDLVADDIEPARPPARQKEEPLTDKERRLVDLYRQMDSTYKAMLMKNAVLYARDSEKEADVARDAVSA